MINSVFSKYDANQTGFIDAKELYDYLKDFFQSTGMEFNPIDRSEIYDLLNYIDVTKSGQISRREMGKYLRSVFREATSK